MNILFISRWFPYPPDNGSKIRVFNLLKYLSRRHSISLLSFAHGGISKESLEEMHDYCRHVSAVQYNGFAPMRLKALLGFFSSRPRSMVDTFSREMRTLVKNQLSHETFDIVVGSQLESTPYALLADGLPRVLEEVELG